MTIDEDEYLMNMNNKVFPFSLTIKYKKKSFKKLKEITINIYIRSIFAFCGNNFFFVRNLYRAKK